MSSESALSAARELFAAGRRVEMGALAAQLGVNRTTLFRWVGSRDALLAALVWERMERALSSAGAAATGKGARGTERLATLLTGLFAGADARARASTPVRAFVANEPATAMRVMTSGPVHDRLIDWFARVIEDETTSGTLSPRYPARQIAELIVKTGEAVFWFDVASGRGLDRTNMGVLLEALCSPPPA